MFPGSDRLELTDITCLRPLSFCWWLMLHFSHAVCVSASGDVTAAATDDGHAQSLQSIICELVKRTCQQVGHVSHLHI